MNPSANAVEMGRPPKRWVLWVGRVLTALPILLMLFSAFMKLARPPKLIEQ